MRQFIDFIKLTPSTPFNRFQLMLYVGVKFVFRIFNLFRPITNWCYVCKREIL